jgi:hypothetical protein
MDLQWKKIIQCSVFVVEHKNEKVLLVIFAQAAWRYLSQPDLPHSYGMLWARGVAAEQEDGRCFVGHAEQLEVFKTWRPGTDPFHRLCLILNIPHGPYLTVYPQMAIWATEWHMWINMGQETLNGIDGHDNELHVARPPMWVFGDIRGLKLAACKVSNNHEKTEMSISRLPLKLPSGRLDRLLVFHVGIVQKKKHCVLLIRQDMAKET